MITQTVLAQATSTDLVDVVSKLGFPIFTVLVFAWAFGTGKIHSSSEVDSLRQDKLQLQDEKKRLEVQVDESIKQYENVVLPTVHDALGAIRDISKIVEQSTLASAKADSALSRLEQVIQMAERLREDRERR